MPYLRQRIDGGHYTVTRYHSIGFVAYQISQEGIEYLRDLGIGLNDFIPRQHLLRLKNRGWATTGGGGVGGPGEETPPPIFSETLLQCLTKWARQDYDEAVTIVLRSSGVAENLWFSPECLKWLASIDGGIPLSALAEFSRRDLTDACQHRHSSAPRVFEELLDRDDTGAILWRFARIIGSVAAVAEHGGSCPAEWAEGLRGKVFAAVRAFLGEQEDEPLPRRSGRMLRPQLCWQVEMERMVALLARQNLPAGMSVSWSLDGEEQDLPVRRQADGAVLLEAITELKRPFNDLSCLVRYLCGDGQAITRSLHVALPERSPLLFTEDGVFVDLGEDASIAPGEYYILVPPGFRELDDVPNCSVLDEYILEPNGWWRWQGKRICIRPECRLGAYCCGEQPGLSWRLHGERLCTVEFLPPCPPVYRGRLPSAVVTATDPSLLRSAFLVARTDDADRPPVYESLTALATDDDGSERRLFDLNNSTQLSRLLGRITLTLSSHRPGPAGPDQLGFVRLPASVDINYVADPELPDFACGVAVTGTGFQIVPDECVGVVHSSGILRASDPLTSPDTVLCLKLDGAATARLPIRIPVTRVRLREREHVAGRWSFPPIEVALGGVRHDTALVIQLRDPPLLEDGLLHCRALPGGNIFCGEEATRPGTYMVLLSRWRDHLGGKVSGEVHIRCESGWVPLATLRGKERLAPPVHDEQLRVVSDLEHALLGCERQSSSCLAEHAYAQARETHLPPAHRDLLLVSAARGFTLLAEYDRARGILDDFGDRTDMPDTSLVRAQIVARRKSHDAVALLNCRNRIDSCPESPQRDLARAECLYRISRLGGGGDESLREARRLLSVLDDLSPIERLQAAVLSGVVCLSVGEKPSYEGRDGSVLGRQVGDFLQAVGLAYDYLRTALPQWRLTTENPYTHCALAQEIADPRDVHCLTACLAQSARMLDAGRASLAACDGSIPCYPLPLLEARQAYLEGDRFRAVQLYKDLARKAGAAYPQVLDEFP